MPDHPALSTRRTFLKAGTRLGAVGLALGSLPRPLHAYFGGDTRAVPIPPIEDDRIRTLAQHAMDAARSAGAGYADIVLRHTRTRLYTTSGSTTDLENMNIGVRALINGYWGFSSSPVWSRDEVVRLAQSATQQAMTSARGKPRYVELAQIPAVRNQHWTMPVTIDPFTVYPDEVDDYLGSLVLYAQRRGNAAGISPSNFNRRAVFTVQQKAMASTEGSYCTQRLYRSSGEFGFAVSESKSRRNGEVNLTTLTPAGLGWELFRNQPLRAQIDRGIEDALEDFRLPIKPIDVGRYDVVLDAGSMAYLLSPTLGLATELDRALGYEANAGGTSYLKDPAEMLGAYKAGSPLLTLTGTRSDSGAVATVKWDDEGVEPTPFSIVKNGVLTNYSVTREGAGWLKEHFAKQGVPLRSHGCATAGDDWFGSMYAPVAQTPNLVMSPGQTGVDVDDLIAGVSRGLAWKNMRFDMDFQQLNGLGTGQTYEIRNGKRSAVVIGAGIMFQAPELLRNIVGIGGPSSAQRFGLDTIKGEPLQRVYHSVSAVPSSLKDVTVLDIMRKA